MKKLLVFIIVVITVFLISRFPDLMIGPGKLLSGHQKLTDSCASCHQAFWGVKNEKCITCHQLSEIGKPINMDSNFSERKKLLFHEKISDLSCPTCHTDHKGLTSTLAHGKFNHRFLNADLEKSCVTCHLQPTDILHQQVGASCNTCHNTNDWKLGTVFKHEMINSIEATKCINCHKKPDNKLHSQLSTNCGDCHQTQSWKEGVKFNHSMISATDVKNCLSCHQRPSDSYHQKIGDDCSQCHTQAQWKPSTFDHSRYFQLDEHHNVNCNTCHTTTNYSIYSCYSCHEHSPSRIQEKHIKHGISNYTNCVSCHKSGNEHEGGDNNKEGGDSEEDD